MVMNLRQVGIFEMRRKDLFLLLFCKKLNIKSNNTRKLVEMYNFIIILVYLTLHWFLFIRLCNVKYGRVGMRSGTVIYIYLNMTIYIYIDIYPIENLFSVLN